MRLLLLGIAFIMFSKSWGQRELPVHPDLPVIRIVTEETLDNENKKLSKITIEAGDDLSSLHNHSGYCGIEFHGNSTLLAPKKSYDIELRDQNNEEVSREILGLKAEEDFILLANYYDRSFLRNDFAFELWRRMGHYAPEHRFCELYLNDEYQGLYVLTEKIKVDRNRLNLDVGIQNSWYSDDPFLFQLSSGYYSVPSRTKTVSGNMIAYKPVYPKPKYNRWLYDTAGNVMEKVEQSIEAILTGDTTIEHFSEYINVASFVDYFLISELTKNPDAFKEGTYFYRERNVPELKGSGKIHMGPVWDFDLAFGNVDYVDFNMTEGWSYLQTKEHPNYHMMPSMWYTLLCDQNFKEQCSERLVELKSIFLKEEWYARAWNMHYALCENISKDALRWGEGSIHAESVGPVSVSALEKMNEIADFYWDRLNWMEGNLLDIECYPPIKSQFALSFSKDIEPNSENKMIEYEGPYTIEVGAPGGRYHHYQYYNYRFMNSLGVVIKSGSSGKISISYEELEPGDYYLEIYQEPEMASYSAVFSSYYLLARCQVPRVD